MKVFEELYNIRLIIVTTIGTVFTMLAMVLVYDFWVIRYAIIGGISLLFWVKRNYFYQYLKRNRE